MNGFERPEDDDGYSLLHYAVRYTLGRQTHAVRYVVNRVKDNWENMTTNERRMIQKDIIQADDLGMRCDEEKWEEVLELEASENGGLDVGDTVRVKEQYRDNPVLIERMPYNEGSNPQMTVTDVHNQYIRVTTIHGEFSQSWFRKVEEDSVE